MLAMDTRRPAHAARRESVTDLNDITEQPSVVQHIHSIHLAVKLQAVQGW